jgi:PadR family transcriptional regulator, regulatory protein PadR
MRIEGTVGLVLHQIVAKCSRKKITIGVLGKTIPKPFQIRAIEIFGCNTFHCYVYCLDMKLDKELVAASSVPLVLSILAEEESYGYAIIQRVKDLSEGQIQWTDGMLYPVLHWLEARGYVQGRWGESEAGRKRRYYALKPGGKRALQEHQDQWQAVNNTLNQLWKPRYA